VQIERKLAVLYTQIESLQFREREFRIIRDEMHKEVELSQQIFRKVLATHDNFRRRYNVEISERVDPFAHQEIENYAKDLSINIQDLVVSTHGLLKLSAQKQALEVRFYDRLIIGGLLVSFAFVTLSVALFGRRVARSTLYLKERTAQIAAGDLVSRIELSGNDELTDLARSVNDMSAKLQNSYEALEDEIEERKRTEESLLESEQHIRILNAQLEQKITKVNETNSKLQEANREMESFTYSVSHDLRAPLRHLSGFVELLVRRDLTGLDEKSRHYLKVISDAAQKMGCLIDDLLSFSRMGRGEMMKSIVDLKQLAMEVIDEISKDLPTERIVQWRIGELPTVTGDRAMLRLVLVNLITNAVKYSKHTELPVIEFDEMPSENNSHTLYVKDNGAGFDMKYVDKLFGLFQRLHSSEEYDGTGVGLANVRRIIARHGGNTWAEGELNKGATFYFTLPR
jgi:signal transduction histidine kinase